MKALFHFNDIFGKNPIIMAFLLSRAKAAAFFITDKCLAWMQLVCKYKVCIQLSLNNN